MMMAQKRGPLWKFGAIFSVLASWLWRDASLDSVANAGLSFCDILWEKVKR